MLIQEHLKWEYHEHTTHDFTPSSRHSLLGNADPILMQNPTISKDKGEESHEIRS